MLAACALIVAGAGVVPLAPAGAWAPPGGAFWPGAGWPVVGWPGAGWPVVGWPVAGWPVVGWLGAWPGAG